MTRPDAVVYLENVEGADLTSNCVIEPGAKVGTLFEHTAADAVAGRELGAGVKARIVQQQSKFTR